MMTDEERELFGPLLKDPNLLARVLGEDDTASKLAAADDSQPKPLEWKTTKEAPEPTPQAPLQQPGVSPNMAFSPQAPAGSLPPPKREAQPSDSSAGGGKSSGIDPGLAFWAAFSKNPVLQQMISEQHNAPAKAAAEKRAAEKWQLERDIMSPLKAQKTRGEIATSASKLADKDPASEYSKSMRKSISQALMMHATRLSAVDPDLAKQMQQAAFSAGGDGVSATQASEMAKVFGGVGDRAIKDAHETATQAEREKMGEAQRQHLGDQDKQGWARIDVMRQRAAQPKPDARARAAQVKNQEKLDDEIEKADWAKQQLLSIADLKQKVNTGPIAGRAQNMLQTVGMATPEFDALKQRLAMVSNRIIKELSGSAVTGNEWSRMQDELANILNDDSNFSTKLANMIELTDSIKQRAINRYSRMNDGSTADQTNTAARVTAGPAHIRAGEQPPPDATPGRAAAGDPKAEAAKAWLQANPNDPKAAAVRKRLQAMGAM